MAVRDDAVYILEALDAVRLAQDFTQGMTEDEFLEDLKTQSAVMWQLEIIGEACGHVSRATREVEAAIRNAAQTAPIR